jgi:hypothetical protein
MSDANAPAAALVPWERYRHRYNARPETFDAYVDVWTSVPEAQQAFVGWVGFAQAASAEPGWVRKHPERVQAAEIAMRSGGYELGPPTEKGARRWVRAQRRRPRVGTLRLFRLNITI